MKAEVNNIIQIINGEGSFFETGCTAKVLSVSEIGVLARFLTGNFDPDLNGEWYVKHNNYEIISDVHKNGIITKAGVSGVTRMDEESVSEVEKLFYSDKFKNIRAKLYKDAYEQGRFDEDFELTYKLGRYAEEGKDGLDNPNFEKVIL